MKPTKNFGLAAMILAGLGAQLTVNAVPTFYTSRAAFLGDARVTTTTAINFDDLSVGTDQAGRTISGVQFLAPGTPTLIVMPGATGVRFPMTPSTSPNVLSPGGSNPALENDDLTLVFDTPVKAAGLDVVFDVAVLSFVSVRFLDGAGSTLYYNGFIPDAYPYQFVGLVTDAPVIKQVVLDEFDPTAPDDNVAYDSVIFSPAAQAPEAGGTAILLGLGLIALARLKPRPA